jgi:hypothetical protein
MIKGLRKRHLQIWTLWAVLLPIGIIAAWMAVPDKVTQESLQSEQVDILPVTLGTQAKKGKYYSHLRTNRDGSKYQLCWSVYRGFNYTSNIYSNSPFLIYWVTKPEYELIGRIGGKQTFYFNLPNDSSDIYSFIIYDPIRKKTIDSLSFNKYK